MENAPQCRDLPQSRSTWGDQQPRPHKSGATWHWRFSGRAPSDVTIGIWGGDIVDAKGFDVWVNPENTDMAMAGYHYTSVSGIIRHMGANWSNSFGDSDDFVFCNLLEEVARKWGVHRPVPTASVFVTKPGRLARTNRVKAILHVACVVPQDPSKPGAGIKPAGDLDLCMRNILETIASRNKKRAVLRSALVPLLAAGTGQGAIRSTSEILVNAAADYLSQHKNTGLQSLMFLAFSPREDELIAGALNAREDLRPADGANS